MATGPQAKITIAADDTPLRQSLREMVGQMRHFGDEAKRSADGAGGPFGALRSHIAGLVSLIGGGVMVAFLRQHIQLQDELSKSAQKAGVTTEQFSAMNHAAKLADVSTQELTRAYSRLGVTLSDAQQGQKTAVDLFQRLKLDPKNIRDADQLLLELADRIGQMGDGARKTGLVVDVFGEKLGPQLLPLLSQGREGLEELRKEAERLGVVVSTEAGRAAEEFNDTLTRLRQGAVGAGQKLATELVPVLQTVADELFRVRDSGSLADIVIKGIRTTFEAVAILGANVAFVFQGIGREIGAIAAQYVALWKLDFSGFRAISDAVKEDGKRAREELDALEKRILGIRDAGGGRGFVNPASVSPGGGGSVGGKRTDPKTSPQAPSSYLSYYEAMLAEEKRVQATLDAGREFTKAQELAFWRFLAANLQLTTADRVTLLRKMSQLEVEVARSRLQQQQALDAEDLQAAEKLALAKVEAQAVAARVAVDAGQLSKAQLAQLEVQFEAERFKIQSAGLQERLRLLALDPTVNPAEMARLKNELLLLEQEHQTRRNQLLGAAAREGSSLDAAIGQTFGSENSWQTMLDGMLLQAQTWQQALGNLFRQTGQIFLQELITKPAAAWLAGMARMLLVKLGFLTQEKAMDAAASTAKVGIKATETAVVVGANAAQAGSGAAASQAGIPIVGPGLALAAMAAIFAAVMALGSRKSARGGYDIPSGVNPLVQAHEEEMILPSPLANAVRRMAEGGAPQGQQAPAYAPEPLPHHSIGDFVLLMRPQFLRMLEGARRDFAFR